MRKSRASILLFSLMVVVVLNILGLAFFLRSMSESRIAERQRKVRQAFCNAEAGIERAIYDLRQDFVRYSNPSWFDGNINGIIIADQSTNIFYDLPYASTSLNEGRYAVQLKNVPSTDREIWVRSTGVVDDVSQTVQVYVKIRDVSIWNNVVFGGTAYTGLVINGNSQIFGSVHILGNNLTSSDLAIDLSGTTILAGNNYDTLPPGLLARIPSISNGEIDTLNSELRAKNGQIGLSGTAIAGQPDDSSNSSKETMDGAYVTDGYGGNKGDTPDLCVFSDNGWSNAYDLEDALDFPELLSGEYIDSDGNSYPNYQTYLNQHSFVLDGNLKIQPGGTFNYSNGYGSISMSMVDGKPRLDINGVIFINGNLEMDMRPPIREITYTGRGSILVTGDVKINVNLLTDSYPKDNIIGIMTPNTIRIGDVSQIDIMGLFYAGQYVAVSKQTNILGTIVSNYFDMGANVPSIFQVPATATNLPPGMIDPGPVWLMQVISWQRV